MSKNELLEQIAIHVGALNKVNELIHEMDKLPFGERWNKNKDQMDNYYGLKRAKRILESEYWKLVRRYDNLNAAINEIEILVGGN